MKFIHAADLHIDSPLRGLEAYEGAPVERVRNATRDALRRLVQLCLEEQADFLIVAGDLFDHDWKDFNTALFVVDQFQKLVKDGIRILVIRGNHDSVAETSLKAPWPTSEHFTLFNHKQAETVVLKDLSVAIHGMSFPERHVVKNLVPDYPQPVKGLFNIGILHTNATGSDEHATYAPCTLEELSKKGYQYWALGHVHQYQILSKEPCHIVYSGNTQGRHIRETGAKGCYVVTVENGAVESMKFVSTDVLRWKQVEIDLTAEQRLEDLGDIVEARLREELIEADGRLLGVRLRIQGNCAAHRQLSSDVARREAEAALRARVGEISDDVWLEKVKWNTRAPVDRESLLAGKRMEVISGERGT
jgi:DNA repair exonuclease SbcCD nuclease subunit